MTDVTVTVRQPRKAWTPEDDAIIIANAATGAAAVAQLLGRPESQIRNRAAKLNVSLRRDGEKRGRKPKVQAV